MAECQGVCQDLIQGRGINVMVPADVPRVLIRQQRQPTRGSQRRRCRYSRLSLIFACVCGKNGQTILATRRDEASKQRARLLVPPSSGGEAKQIKKVSNRNNATDRSPLHTMSSLSLCLCVRDMCHEKRGHLRACHKGWRREGKGKGKKEGTTSN